MNPKGNRGKCTGTNVYFVKNITWLFRWMSENAVIKYTRVRITVWLYHII